jgi:serine phosphatase RsbU (regulator of sigma subunit)
MKKIVLFNVLMLSVVLAFGQDIDALKHQLKQAKHDTTRCNILNQLIDGEPNQAVWERYNAQMQSICERNLSDNNLIQPIQDQYKNYLGNAYTNTAIIYENQGNIQQALKYYTKSVKLFEFLNDKAGEADLLASLGQIYKNQGETEKAIVYLTKSLSIKQSINDSAGVSLSLRALGYTYLMAKNNLKAKEYFNKALIIDKAIGNKNGTSHCLNGLALTCEEKTENNIALMYYKQSLALQKELGKSRSQATILANIGLLYHSSKNNFKALYYAQQALMLSKELGFPHEIKQSTLILYKIYKAMGNSTAALNNYEIYITMRDSISNETNRKATYKSQITYEFDKKETVYKAAQQVAHAKQAQQRIVLIAVTLLLLGGAVFAILLYKRYKLSQQQKQIIEQQKHLVDEKHKEITDSINYAERIQRALLASDAFLKAHLPQHFLLFKPKDVVSGDFYWGAQLANKEFALVVADSTGHGVPGAIMSMLNIASLEKAIAKGIKTPNLLLEKTRQLIIDKLKNDGSAEGGKDGMDATLLCFDFETNTLRCACANNPVWIIRTNELIEIKPDKMPVGKHDRDTTPFTQHKIQLQTGDVVYTFTDGYADQFGGEKGKKFMYKPFKELLLNIAHLPMDEQQQLLVTTFNTWKGELEQIDDVCVMGIRI